MIHPPKQDEPQIRPQGNPNDSGFRRDALEKIFPTMRQQRCWMHKTGNVLNYLPKRTQPKTKKILHGIWQAETREDANAAFAHLADVIEGADFINGIKPSNQDQAAA